MSQILNWRQVYVFTIGLRFLFGLSNSYIHPDEHFQSFEVVCSKILGYSTSIPWEFTSSEPVRSYGPLYIFYGPILWLISFFNISISPIGIWYLLRVQLIVVSWLITDMCLYRILPTKHERVKAVFFTSTSYITLVHQSHCFSNSLETPLLLVCLMLINDFRFELEVLKVKSCNYEKLIYLGILIGIGIFNRITFAGFLILPSFFVLKYIWKFKLGFVPIFLSFALTCLMFIYIDTFAYTGQFDLHKLVITPLNNLIYNTNVGNLALHGLHPYYTHILINFPQILGPGIIYLCYKFKNIYYKTTPFITLVSGLIFLSLVPHQEARFLIPLLPIATCCFDFQQINEGASKPLAKVLLWSWYFFNIVMCLLMGVFHQGGVIPVLDYTYQHKPETFTQIWWRSYTPPTWILGDDSVDLINLDQSSDSTKILIDTMGAEHQDIYKLLSKNKGSMFVAPISSINCDFNPGLLKLIWKYDYHLDLDHLNFDSLHCLQPGLGIYEIL